jgi:hypothetical protein
MRCGLLLLCVLSGAGCGRAKVQPTLPVVTPIPTISPTASLRFESKTSRCGDSSAVGDTVYAVVVRGGSELTPPLDSGTTALFVIGEAAPGRLDAKDKSRFLETARFRLDPVAFVTPRGRLPFRGVSPAIESRVFNPPDSPLFYMCVRNGSMITYEHLRQQR